MKYVLRHSREKKDLVFSNWSCLTKGYCLLHKLERANLKNKTVQLLVAALLINRERAHAIVWDGTTNEVGACTEIEKWTRSPIRVRRLSAGRKSCVSFDQRGTRIGGEGIRERIARAIGIGGGQINLGKMFCDTCMSSSPSRLSHLIHRLHLPFWASNTRIGLRPSLGPWAGCIWNRCSTTRAAKSNSNRLVFSFPLFHHIRKSHFSISTYMDEVLQ